MPVAKLPNLGEDNQKAYDDLIVAVEASDEVLSLLLAVCDEPQLQNEIIQQYEAELQPSIRPYQVLLSRKEPSLKEAIAEVVKDDPYLQSGSRAVITVVGADQLLSRRLGEERSEKEIFFGYLQWTREGLREYPYPIILWLTNSLLTELSRKAPDFWSWRKDVFRFIANEMHIELVQSDEKSSSSMTQINLDYVRSWQTKVAGRTSYIGEIHLFNASDPQLKTLVPPETLEDDSIPLEDLQQLTNQTEQQQGNAPLLATLYSQLGLAYANQVKLGEIEASQTTIEQAVEWFEKAARVQEALGIIVDLAKSLSWLGYLYELQGQYTEAEPLLQRALTIFEQQLESKHPFVASTLQNLSVSYVLQGRYAEARSLLQQKLLNIPNNLPYGGTSLFIGRETELAQLHNQLQRRDRVAISVIAGMGGIGKTELALQYALKHLRDGTYPSGICWVRARQDIGTQILAFARTYLELEAPEDLDLVAKVRWCWRHWHQGEVLVIFDDVTNDTAIQPFLPPSDPRFKVLLTTRLQLGAPVNRLVLDVLTEDAALEFLRSILDDEERINQQLDAARTLCAWLGYLPLGLELAARYLDHKPDLSLTRLLHRLQDQGLSANALTRPEVGMTASLNIQAAFELSWAELPPHARRLCGLLGIFALAPIAWALVQQCLPEWETEDLEDCRDEELLGRSLLARVGQGRYQLHQLIREFFAVKLETEWAAVGGAAVTDALRRRFAVVLTAVAKTIPYTVTLDVIARVEDALPHLAVVATGLTHWLEGVDKLWAGTGLARVARAQSRWQEAKQWSQAALLISEQQLGADHPDTATSLNNLAGLYQAMGRYAEAEPLFQRSLAIKEQQLGADHPSTATSLNNLAQLYQAMGRYAAAEPLYQRSLAIMEQQLGADHPDTAASLNNLAELYRAMGRYADAEPLYQRSLAIKEQQLGADHPSTASSLNNLAELYKAMGRYAEAEPLYQRSLAICEQQLGADHPNTAQGLNNLAALYYAMGRYAEAEPSYQRSLAIWEQQLGADHPNTAQGLNNLAVLYQAMGRYAEAEPLYLRTLAIWVQSLGGNHPSTQTVLGNFRYLIQQAVQSGQAGELSAHPTTQAVLQQVKSEGIEG